MYFIKPKSTEVARRLSQAESLAFEKKWEKFAWDHLLRRKNELARIPGFLDLFDKKPLACWRKMLAVL